MNWKYLIKIIFLILLIVWALTRFEGYNLSVKDLVVMVKHLKSQNRL